MSTNYWFKSVEVSNYRGLRHLEIPRFRRVNVIGGLNGSGKTTLLESLFTIADWKSPVAVMKHSLWRQLLGSIDFVSNRAGRWKATTEHPDQGRCRLLRARPDRPRRRATEQRDELPSLQPVELHLRPLARAAG
jgi:hypothetical protein